MKIPKLSTCLKRKRYKFENILLIGNNLEGEIGSEEGVCSIEVFGA
jgi:hypothetical protein